MKHLISAPLSEQQTAGYLVLTYMINMEILFHFIVATLCELVQVLCGNEAFWRLGRWMYD